MKEDQDKHNLQGNRLPSSHDHPHDLTPEEVGKLQRDLKSLFHKQVSAEHSSISELDNPDLQLDKIIDLFSSFISTATATSNACTDDLKQKDGQPKRSSSLVASTSPKDVCLANSKSTLGKRSLTFLLKKMFVCGSGFAPRPSFKDPIPESRMDKHTLTVHN